jgi:hypothetical protein
MLGSSWVAAQLEASQGVGMTGHAIIWVDEHELQCTRTSSTLWHNPVTIPNMHQEAVPGLFEYCV